MIILLDCDTVLADLMGDTIKVINKELAMACSPERVKYEDQHDFWLSTTTAHLGFNDDKINAIMSDVGFIENLTVCPGAQEGVEALRELGEVYVLTKPSRHSPTWVYERLRWLKKNFDIDDDHVAHTGGKHLYFGDVFVDDLYKNIRQWNSRWQYSHSVLWDAPWNQKDDAHYRTKDWGELVEWCEVWKKYKTR
jgi:5'(3')-deoxyribonucleotidase